ncbi:MAG: TIGR00266 family protein [Mycoplasmatales bacterium]
MEYKYLNKNDFPIIEFTLQTGEQITCERGSVLYFDSEISLVGKKNGSLLGAFGKSMLGGESLFKTIASATADNQVVGIAPKGFGSITEIKLEGINWYISDGGYLASTKDVDFTVTSQKGIANKLFAGTGGFFILKTKGLGTIFIESTGSLIEFELDGSKEFLIDNNHLIAWEETIDFRITPASGVLGFKTGEGLVTALSGKGKVIIQSRNKQGLNQLWWWKQWKFVYKVSIILQIINDVYTKI